MKVVHLGTVVQSSFGVVDDEGNVLQQVTVGPTENREDILNIKVLNGESFDGVAEALLNTKKKLEEQANAPVSTESESQEDSVE